MRGAAGKRSRVFSLFCFFFAFLALSLPQAGALYSYEALPFAPDAQGTFRGEVYIDGGHGLGFSPYTQSFELPEGDVLWARLYIGIWGGTENYEGWVRPEFNGNGLEQLSLAGVNDENENVYCTGHGVYWAAYDVSGLTTGGENTAEVRTSQGEAGNRLDGRVYGVVLVAACEKPDAPLTSYQVLSGNVNLHGKGWSGSLVNVNDRADVSFSVGGDSETESARLYAVYLTGSKGLPDYLEFNGEMLGVAPSYLSESGEGARDIANELSYDAAGDEGLSSSYFDIERFDVLEFLRPRDNTVGFLRGEDTNGDGEIDDLEGEDYLHPVLTALVLSFGDGASALPDLYPEIGGEVEPVEGTNTEIPFVINNPGAVCTENSTLSFRVDGTEVSAVSVPVGPSGVYRSSFTWPAEKGEHLLEISADSGEEIKESDEENNACSLTVRVRTKPDLSVSLGEPVKIETEDDSALASLLFLPIFTLFGFRRKKSRYLLLIAIVFIAGFSGCVGEEPAEEVFAFTVPLIINNSGEATARNFDAELFLDGESFTVLNIPEMAGQSSIEEKIRVEAPKGAHTLGAKVDGREHVLESDEENNAFETIVDFL